jgi:predicted ATP-binding protein involved in virulence
LLDVAENVQYSVEVRTKLLPLRYSIIHSFSTLTIIEEIGMIKATPGKTGQDMKRIKQISVKNLFGMFDHTIFLNVDERITIIHGPNGFGKTAILRLLDTLFSQSTGSQSNSALRTIPFEEFRVCFDDGTDFWVSKANVAQNENNDEDVLKTLQGPIFHFNDPVQGRTLTLPLLSIYPILNRLQLLRIGNKTFMQEDVAANNLLEETQRKEREVLQKNIKLLNTVRGSISLRLIETQRLQRMLASPVMVSDEVEFDEQPVIENTVASYSQEIARTIEAKLAESTALTQSLDRTFPARLVSPTVRQRNVTEDELRAKLVALEHKRKYLMDAGLLDQEDSDAIQVQEKDQIDESTKAVLSVYVEDAEKKLGVFDELANKIDLLKRIINKRFLYKEMVVSKEQGFVFTNANKVVLSPTELSSGEQHELILFYELLFKTNPGSLILIDEPEISLHVVWQEQFLEDVQAVTRLSDIDVLLATHSPDIIAGRRDLLVELKGPN